MFFWVGFFPMRPVRAFLSQRGGWWGFFSPTRGWGFFSPCTTGGSGFLSPRGGWGFVFSSHGGWVVFSPNAAGGVCFGWVFFFPHTVGGIFVPQGGRRGFFEWFLFSPMRLVGGFFAHAAGGFFFSHEADGLLIFPHEAGGGFFSTRGR